MKRTKWSVVWMVLEVLSSCASLVASLVISLSFHQQRMLGCSLDGPCSRVTSSIFGQIAGVRVSDIGVAFSVWTITLCYLGTSIGKSGYTIKLLSLGVGSIVSIALQAVSIFYVHEVCPLCLGYCCSIVLAFVSCYMQRSAVDEHVRLRNGSVLVTVVLAGIIVLSLRTPKDLHVIEDLTVFKMQSLLSEVTVISSGGSVGKEIYCFLDVGCDACQDFARELYKRKDLQHRVSLVIYGNQRDIEEVCEILALSNGRDAFWQCVGQIGKKKLKAEAYFDEDGSARREPSLSYAMFHGAASANRKAVSGLKIKVSPTFVLLENRSIRQLSREQALKLAYTGSL